MSHAEAGLLGYRKSARALAKERAMRHWAAMKSWGKKKCPACGRLIPYEKRRNKHCNHACAAVKGAEARSRLLAPKCCTTCGKKLVHTQKLCCSYKCAVEHRYQSFVNRWLQGEDDGCTYHGMQTSMHIHRWLRQTRGEWCEVCGWHEKNPRSGVVPLQLSHENGNPEDNRPTNLKLRCPNCHALTPTFGALNRGKGRSYRYHKERV